MRFFAVVGLLLLAGCASGQDLPDDNSPEPDWVVVSFDVPADGQPPDGHPGTSMDMIRAELRIDRALRKAGLGVVDGNEAGRASYELFFTGDDASAMWEVLEPVVAEAPFAWKRAELRDGLDDPDQTVIRP